MSFPGIGNSSSDSSAGQATSSDAITPTLSGVEDSLALTIADQRTSSGKYARNSENEFNIDVTDRGSVDAAFELAKFGIDKTFDSLTGGFVESMSLVKKNADQAFNFAKVQTTPDSERFNKMANHLILGAIVIGAVFLFKKG